MLSDLDSDLLSVFDSLLELPLSLLLSPDELDEEEDPEDDDEDLIKRAESLMLVGPTRAKDRLFIYYKKDNVYFDRLSKHPESVTFRVYPEDFAEGTK